MRGRYIAAIVGLVVLVVSIPLMVGSDKPRRAVGVNEVYFTNPYHCTVYTLDPSSKEYKVQTVISHIDRIRIFLDRTNGVEEVTWRESFWFGNKDVEVHVGDRNKVRGNLEGD